MRGRFLTVVVLIFLLPMLLPSTIAQQEQPEWRSIGIDPETWTDGPVEEETPMKESFEGNAILLIEVTYYRSLTSDEYQGSIVIELFEQWAPITTSNIIEHVEIGLYDGIFFHRVVDDFVIQSGDPECKTEGVYPITSPQCSSGGTGETIPLEHDENLSHVDGAMGMARGAEEDSGDSQWYITDTEQHGLDPENRDDGGYAVFGIVRDGMTFVREIASTPTATNPLSDQGVQNPGPDLLGRPIREVRIDSMRMIGVSDPYGNINSGEYESQSYNTISDFDTKIFISITFIVAVLIFGTLVYITQIDPPKTLEDESELVLDAVLFDEGDDPFDKQTGVVIFEDDSV